jgi:dihydrofolate reductase
MHISLIVATDKQGVIGKDNVIPWNMPADMAHFKQTTLGHPIIMGRKTFESIGRPLPGRQNIVVSRQSDFSPLGVQVAHSLDQAIALAVVSHVKEIFIIGGQSIYEEALAKASKIYLTLIHADVKGDRYFKYEPSEWQEVSRQHHKADVDNPFSYDFIVLERQHG